MASGNQIAVSVLFLVGWGFVIWGLSVIHPSLGMIAFGALLLLLAVAINE